MDTVAAMPADSIDSNAAETSVVNPRKSVEEQMQLLQPMLVISVLFI